MVAEVARAMEAARREIEREGPLPAAERATREDLLRRGIYQNAGVTVPLKGGVWREPSMVLLMMAQQRVRQSKAMVGTV